MSTIQKYKPLPPVSDLDPGFEPGWRFDVTILQAEPEDRVGSIIIAESTKEDEKHASVRALIVAISPTAFRNQDWDATGLPLPYKAGDVVITKRYPASVDVVGRDGRKYKIVKDEEILGKWKE